MTSEELAKLGLRVKQLDWWRERKGTFFAHGIFGTYGIWDGYYSPPGMFGGIPSDDPKASAQAHYAARILSALEVIATPDAMIREAEARGLERAADIAFAYMTSKDPEVENARINAAIDFFETGVDKPSELVSDAIRAEAAALRGTAETT